MEMDMEFRLKMAEEYIHQQYVNECKESGWNIKRKANLYKDLPPSMHEPILDRMADEVVVDYLQALIGRIYENRLWSSKDYDNAPPYIKEKQPKWLLILIEKVVNGTFENCLDLLGTDFKYFKDAEYLRYTDDGSQKNWERMMELMHKHCQKLCGLGADDHEEGKD